MKKLIYKLVKRAVPRDPEGKYMGYAIPVPRKRLKRRDLIEIIADKTSLMTADVASVLEAFFKEVPAQLLDGNTIDVGDLGTFYPTLSSEGRENREDFNQNLIQQVRIRFRPSMLISDTLNSARYEHDPNDTNGE